MPSPSPALLVALFLFPAYHGFPPYPLHRPFWSQAADHYFYVMYSFIVMGAATVYEWDLLFPDLLDIFVLSPLPIARRRLFFARVLALDNLPSAGAAWNQRSRHNLFFLWSPNSPIFLVICFRTPSL